MPPTIKAGKRRAVTFLLLAALSSPVSRDFMARLYEDYRHPMWRYACAITGDEDMADDAVHTSFAALIGKAELLQSLGSRELDAYITITVKRAAIRLRAKSQPIPLDLVDEPADSAERPDDFTLRMAEYRTVQEAVQALPDHYRDVICLRYLNDENYGDIAAVMGITEGNARVMVHRALKRMKASILATWGESR